MPIRFKHLPAALFLIVPAISSPVFCSGGTEVVAPDLPAGWTVRHLDVSDGLAHNQINDILEDRDQFLWLATADGLQRFDARRFETWNVADARDGAPVDPSVYRLAESADGTIWAGTRHKLLRLGPDRRALVPVAENVNVQSLGVDAADRLWVGTHNRGLLRLERDRLVAAGTDAMRQGPVRHINWDGRGRMWVTVRTSEGSRMYRSDGPSGFELAASGALFGPAMHDARGNTFLVPGMRVPPDRVVQAGDTARRSINGYAPEPGGRVWSMGLAGIEFWSAESCCRSVLLHLGGQQDYLGNEILAGARASSGIVWAGSYRGLFALDPNLPGVGPAVRTGDGHWVRQPVSSIALDAAGRIRWLGTYGGGLLAVDPETESLVEQVRLPTLREDGDCDFVWTLRRIGPDRLVAGTPCGLVSIDFDDGRVVATFDALDARDLAVLDGNVLAAGVEAPPSILTPGLQPLGAMDGPTAEAVAVGAGGIWGGSPIRFVNDLSWLYRWRRDGTLDRRIRLPASAVVYDLSAAGPVLWVATAVGLFRVDPDYHRVRYVPLETGGNVIYSVSVGPDGKLWLGTNQGLVQFDPADATETLYLEEHEFNRRARIGPRAGRLILGTLAGPVEVNLGSLQQRRRIPPVRLARVEVSGANGARIIPPTEWNPLILRPGENALTATMAVLNFTRASENRYRYRLLPVDTDWVEADTPDLRYAGLRPGDYRLMITGSSGAGIWNPDPVGIDVEIMPYFRQTVWFRLLIFGAAAALVGGIVFLRQRRRRALESERKRIAADLHDELGSEISALALSAAMVGRKPYLEAPDRQRLTEVTDGARQVLGGLRDIVWYLAPEHDRIDDLGQHIKTLANRLLADHEVAFDLPPALLSTRIPMARRRNLLLIYKEALHNVLRHARAARVRVALRKRHRRLELTIEDDGAGFDPDAPRTGNGIANMQRRARAMHGELTVERRRGGGTRVTVVFPA